jgi:adenylate cyclase
MIVQSVPLSNEDDRLHRMLLAYVRQEFEAPVRAILGYAEIMIEDAQQQGNHSFLSDLRRLNQSAVRLKELVLGLLDPNLVDREFTDFRRHLRHDLRTPISSVKGLGEMLLEDAQAQGNTAQVRDLEKLLETTARLLAQIDALVDFGGRALPATADRPVTGSTVLKPVPALSSSLASHQARPSRILIVDDTEATRELLARRLGREGHHIVEVANGRAALDRVTLEIFDLILLDMMMPDLNGYEVLTQLKADVRFRHIPVIVISALDEIDSVVRCPVSAHPWRKCGCAKANRRLPPDSGPRRKQRRSYFSIFCQNRLFHGCIAARHPLPTASTTSPSFLVTSSGSLGCRCAARRVMLSPYSMQSSRRSIG